MKTHISPVKTSITALLLLLCWSAPASARELGATLHGEVGARLSLGDWADISGPGFGGTLGLHYTIIPNVTLTARIGYFAGLPRTFEENVFFFRVEGKSKTNELPILFGGRFYLPGGSERGALWGGLEVGMTQITLKGWFENSEGDRDYFLDDNELEPTLVLGMGYDMGQLNPHLALHWIPAEGDGDFLAMVLTLGFDLWRF